MHTILKHTIFPVIGVMAGVGLGSHFAAREGTPPAQPTGQEEPLYWVAPMDPDFRRDQPGKSPMGMDLVPVYASREPQGVVQISPQVENSLGVRTVTVSRGSLDETVSTVGYVQYDQDTLVHVHPRIEGWIEKLHVSATGDRVTRGAPLYELYSPQLVNAQEEFVSALRQANAPLQRAAEARLRALQVEDAVIDTLRRERSVLQSVTFTSPQDGVIENLDIREGFFVGPGTTLMSIANLSHVWVEAEVFESQASRVAVGQHVVMRLDYLPGRVWQGTVDTIYPTLDASTRTLRLRLRFDNADQVLRPNMFAQLEIHTGDQRERLLIPREALIRTGHQNRVVLALGDGRFRSLSVETGLMSGNLVEISTGLSEGDRIVSSAQFLIDSESNRSAEFGRMDPHHDSHATPDSPALHDHQHEQHQHEQDKPEADSHAGHVMPSATMNHDQAAHREQEDDQPEGDSHAGHVMPSATMNHDQAAHHEQEDDQPEGDSHAGHVMPSATMNHGRRSHHD